MLFSEHAVQPEQSELDQIITQFLSYPPTQFFTVRALDLLTQYVFVELLELLDLSWRPSGVEGGCPVVHLMPRFVRQHSTEGTAVGEVLPISAVLEQWMHHALTPLVDVMELPTIRRFSPAQWSSYIADLRGTLTTFPGKVRRL